MKKLFIVPVFLLTLTACSGTTPANYDALSQAAIKAEVQKMADTAEALGSVPQEVVGKMSFGVDGVNIPSVLDGKISFSSDYNIFSSPSGWSFFKFLSPSLKASGNQVDMFAEEKNSVGNPFSLEASAKEIELLSAVLSTYAKIADVKFNFDTADQQAKMILSSMIVPQVESFNKKLAGKWIDITTIGQNSYSSSADIKNMQNISRKILGATKDDVVQFISNNNILKSEWEAKVDGTKYTYNVSLDVDNAIKFAEKASKDLTGKEIPNDEKDNLRKKLTEKIVVSGTVTYDTKNSLYADYKLDILNKESNETIKADILRNGNDLTIKISAVNNENGVFSADLNLTTEGKDSTFGKAVITIKDHEDKLTKMNFEFGAKDKMITSAAMNLEANAFKAFNIRYVKDDSFDVLFEPIYEFDKSFTVTNKFTGDTFAGKLTLEGEDAFVWTGKSPNNILETLDVTIHNNVNSDDRVEIWTLKLAKQNPSDDMASGKLTIDLEGQQVSADVSLQMEKSEKFGLVIENISVPAMPANMIPFKKFEIFASWKVNYVDKKIEIPTDVLTPEQAQEILSTQE